MEFKPGRLNMVADALSRRHEESGGLSLQLPLLSLIYFMVFVKERSLTATWCQYGRHSGRQAPWTIIDSFETGICSWLIFRDAYFMCMSMASTFTMKTSWGTLSGRRFGVVTFASSSYTISTWVSKREAWTTLLWAILYYLKNQWSGIRARPSCISTHMYSMSLSSYMMVLPLQRHLTYPRCSIFHKG